MSEVMTDRSLGPGEKPVVRTKYVHMLREDHATWTRFLKSGALILDQIWYDVHVGAPMAVPKGSPEFMKNVVDGISRKRIDVVGLQGKTLYIIEVKPHANMQAVGQAATYVNLFNKEFKVDGPVKPLIVSIKCDRDILEIAEELGVEIISVEGVVL